MFSVAPWPLAQPVPETSSNKVVPDHFQRQIRIQTPQLVRTPDSWKSIKTPSPKQNQKQSTPPQSTPSQSQSINEHHNSNDDVFGEPGLIQLQVRDHRGRGKKKKDKGKAQSQAQLLLTSHQLIQESMQSKLQVLGQMLGKTGAANETKNPSAQSSRINQIAGWSDYNFGSSMDMDMEQMMERDLTQTQSTTNDGLVIPTASSQLGTASWHAGGETTGVIAAQRANIESMNF
ncbi:MAG: hypothetical protein EZS28_029630 [Streblomastix strix]|uniref:Uncharacterized protein n=1 Tax=Streblomastix strix TaxID=222440 RepID=A0A5J4UVX0_9EUKA|nr:MAG: hypothetical protein EZS28_029630 [Streblomastix strix]